MPSRWRSLIRELGERAHDRERQGGHRGVLAGEGELFFDELDLDTAVGECSDGGAEVVEVAGQSVHRVHEYGVAVADEGEHGRQLRALKIFAGHVVGKGPVHVDTVELPHRVLLEGADSGVPDALTVDDDPSDSDVSG